MTVVIVALAGAVTLVTSFLSSVPFAYRNQSAHVAIESAATVIALVTAYLAWGRFRHSALPTDLALSFSLAFVSVTLLTFTAAPAALAFPTASRFSVWTSLCGSIVSTLAFATAAFVPDHRLRHPLRRGRQLALLGVLVLAAIAEIVGATAGRLPIGVDPSLAPAKAAALSGHPAIVAVQFLLAALLFAAAVGFSRRAAGGERFYAWLSTGAIVGAFARVNYALFPSLYSHWVFTGDALRLAFYLVLLLTVLREIGVYQGRIARSAALDERRRLARDYHDGMAQELAFIASRLRMLEREYEFLGTVRAASERALQECRWSIRALTVPGSEDLSAALTETLEEIATREGTGVALDIAPHLALPVESREALLRIASEALTNAARHGRAQRVHVELMNGDGVVLRIRDDGIGFDTRSAEGRGGFGLVSMRERVAAVGGELSVVSAEGAGTLVEVRLP